MKGFPNQVADLNKLAIGMASLVSVADGGQNAKDDGVFGEALVRAGVAGTGHVPMPVDEYLGEQLKKPISNQSFRTTARGLRELYRILGFIDDSDIEVQLTDLGRKAASYADASMGAEQMDFWRTAIRNMTQSDDYGSVSHPYQVLLRLISQKPGITRAKSALALEALDDSAEELARIVALADLPEEEIRTKIGVSESNWYNAKKILPRFAEQLQDVIKDDQSFRLADAPGQAEAGIVEKPSTGKAIRAPRSSRSVTPESIGRAATGDVFDEIAPAKGIDAQAVAKTNKLRFDRHRRHNLIVQELASRLTGMQLFEEPFDILALTEAIGALIEVKSLDGTVADEVDRVREALSQLLYYEAFVTSPIAGATIVRKIACFERPISEDHRQWLNRSEIGVIWKTDTGFTGDALARATLSAYLD